MAPRVSTTGTRTSQRALSPRKRPRQARSRATWAALLEGAAQVFAASGYAETTTDDIAEQAGVSIGSLYQYFPGKDAILVALLEEHLAEAAATLGPIVATLDDDPPLGEVVRELVEASFAIHARSPRLHQVLTEEAPIPSALRERLEEAERAASATLARYLARRDGCRQRDRSLVADVAVAMVDTMSHRLTIHPPRGHAACELAEETTRVVLAYLERVRA